MNKVLPFWQDEKYYQVSKEGSKDINHPGMKLLFNYAQKVTSILDLGCGEGTRLNWVVNKRKINAVGIDVSSTGVKIAKKQFPDINFFLDDAEAPKIEGEFELVFSAFVLEHVSNPQRLIENAIRLAKKDKGIIVFMAPNFGAPNRRSPNSKEGKLKKLWNGFIGDFKVNAQTLGWINVTPKSEKYSQVDDDALSEPYLYKLIKFLKEKRIATEYSSSLWSLEPWSLNPRKTFFRLLGVLDIFPFKYWGPQFIIVIKK